MSGRASGIQLQMQSRRSAKPRSNTWTVFEHRIELTNFEWSNPMRLAHFGYPNTSAGNIGQRPTLAWQVDWNGSPQPLPDPFLFRAIIEHHEPIEGSRPGRLQMVQKQTGLKMDPPLRGELPFQWDERDGVSRGHIEMNLGGGVFFPKCGEYAIEVAVDEEVIGAGPIFIASSQASPGSATVTLTMLGPRPGIESALGVVLAAFVTSGTGVTILVDPAMERYDVEPESEAAITLDRVRIVRANDETSAVVLRPDEAATPFVHKCELYTLELLRTEARGISQKYEVRLQRYGAGKTSPTEAQPSA
jgi:hypothetical protein